MAVPPVPLPPLQLSAAAGPAVSGVTSNVSFSTGPFAAGMSSPFGALGDPSGGVVKAALGSPVIMLGLGALALYAYTKWR